MCHGEIPVPLRPFAVDPAVRIAAGSVGIDEAFCAGGFELSVGEAGTPFWPNVAQVRSIAANKTMQAREASNIGASYTKNLIET